MKQEWREIAAAIDERVRQLAAQGVSDSALVDQMVGYMQPLQRLWNGTTDDELDGLLTAYPGFVRYATLMEELSATALRGRCPRPHPETRSLLGFDQGGDRVRIGRGN